MLALAAALAHHVQAGEVIAVAGELGAGKTTFVRGLATALVGEDVVSSPTFTFRHRYGAPGTATIEHLDLYRLDDESELPELGLEEAFDAAVITVVEWPERAPSLVRDPAWRVAISGSGDAPRTVVIARRE